MIQEGQIVLFKFPQTNQTSGKLRPALVIRKLPSLHDDWLICMVSSQLSQQVPEFDEVIKDEDADFLQSGLKTTSIIRIARLAVVNKSVLLGSIGNIGAERFLLIKKKLSAWIIGT
jgi:mRNA interferase MazF